MNVWVAIKRSPGKTEVAGVFKSADSARDFVARGNASAVSKAKQLEFSADWFCVWE